MSLWLLNSFIHKSLFCSFYSYQSLPHQTWFIFNLFFFLLGTGKSLGHFAGMFSLGYISIIHFHFLCVITYTVASFCNKFLQWIRNNFFLSNYIFMIATVGICTLSLSRSKFGNALQKVYLCRIAMKRIYISMLYTLWRRYKLLNHATVIT